jgi:hypothetical protein
MEGAAKLGSPGRSQVQLGDEGGTQNPEPKTALSGGGFLGAEDFEAVVAGFEGVEDAFHDGL